MIRVKKHDETRPQTKFFYFAVFPLVLRPGGKADGSAGDQARSLPGKRSPTDRCDRAEVVWRRH